jgi:hypothetical protein
MAAGVLAYALLIYAIKARQSTRQVASIRNTHAIGFKSDLHSKSYV